MNIKMSKASKNSYTIYCHFSFKRPKGENYGLFAVAFYSDFEGKKLIKYTVRKYDLWENQQFVTAIQSYEHALLTIYENQGLMKSANINQVMLVTDNSTLAGWIVNPKKNKAYTSYMEKAVKPYRIGSYKEIILGIGICDPRKSEKSYKFCREDLVENTYIPKSDTNLNRNDSDCDKSAIETKKYHVLNIDEHRSVLDILGEDKSIPEISGIINFE